MGRRSDHTREELRALFVTEGHRQLAEVGLARFSARDVAKRVGYSIGTVYNVFGSYDGLMLAINGYTLSLWSDHMRLKLSQSNSDRIAALVQAYFTFAAQHSRTWIALFEHHMADFGPAPDWYKAQAAEVMGIAGQEVARAVEHAQPEVVAALTRSLLATVHGHCVFALYRTFDMLGETAPIESALARVREAIAAAKRSSSVTGVDAKPSSSP
jgi:AcrR family transcriptional regulator